MVIVWEVFVCDAFDAKSGLQCSAMLLDCRNLYLGHELVDNLRQGFLILRIQTVLPVRGKIYICETIFNSIDECLGHITIGMHNHCDTSCQAI